jgi:hypothetical protein
MTNHSHILTRRGRLAPALAAAAAALTFGMAHDADAAVYCVDRADCEGIKLDGDLQQALTLAGNSAGVADKILVGPKTYSTPTKFKYVGGGAGNDLTLSGVPGQTVIETDTPTKTGSPYLLEIQGNGTDTVLVEDLKLRVPVSPDNTGAPFGLVLTNGTAEDVTVEAATDSGYAIGAGIELWGGAHARSVHVSFPPAVKNSVGVRGTGQGTQVEDSEIEGARTGITYSPKGTGRVRRVLIDIPAVPDNNLRRGIWCNGCPDLDVDDSVIRLAGGTGVEGMLVSGSGPPAASLDASHVTIVGAGVGNGARAYTNSGTPAVLRIDNCVIAGVAQSLVTSGSGGEAIEARNCNYSAPSLKVGIGPIDAQGTTSQDPAFVDQAGGDLRPRWNSPLVDAARTEGVFVEPPLTADRSKRAVDGNLDGEARPDVGAYEYAAGEPYAVIEGPTTATEGETITLNGSGSFSGDTGEPLDYSWALPGGAQAHTPAVDLKLPAGEHKLSLTVKDPTGKQASSYRTVTIVPSASPEPKLLSSVRVVPVELARGKAPRLRLRLSKKATVTARVERRVHGKWRRVRTITRKLGAGKRAVQLPRATYRGSWRVVVRAKRSDRVAKATALYRVR